MPYLSMASRSTPMPKAKPVKLLRVDAAVLQHLGVDHAGAEDLEPAGLLAGAAALAVLPAAPAADRAGDVDLGPRLDEREVARAEARPGPGPEVGAGEGGQRALEIREGDALADAEPLDLVEHGRVGLVVVGAVDAPRADDADGRRPRAQHGADLHRRGVGAQQDLPLRPPLPQRGRVDVEGVLHVPGGVIGRDVERLEVVPVELDLRPGGDLVAEAGEDGGDLVGGPGERVPVAAGQEAPPRQRDVEGRAAELGLQAEVGQGGLPGGEQGLHLVADAVGDLADPRPLLGGQAPHAAQRGGELALLAEEADPERLERRLVGGAGAGLPGCGGQRLERCEEVGHARLRRGRP